MNRVYGVFVNYAPRFQPNLSPSVIPKGVFNVFERTVAKSQHIGIDLKMLNIPVFD